MPDATPRKLTRRQRILGCVNVLSLDELDVLLAVAEGMVGGRHVYGALNVANDRRDFAREALEEIRDCLVYVGAKLVQVRRDC